MDEPSIQRGPYDGNGTPLRGNSGYGTPLRGTVTKRMETQMQAAAMGIDTKGMSTREIRKAITERQEVERDMADLIKDTISKLPANQRPNDSQPEVTTRKIEDPPNNFVNGGGDKKHERSLGTPIEFYCWKDGVVGTITFDVYSPFSPLIPPTT